MQLTKENFWTAVLDLTQSHSDGDDPFIPNIPGIGLKLPSEYAEQTLNLLDSLIREQDPFASVTWKFIGMDSEMDIRRIVIPSFLSHLRDYAADPDGENALDMLAKTTCAAVLFLMRELIRKGVLPVHFNWSEYTAQTSGDHQHENEPDSNILEEVAEILAEQARKVQ